ncbi:MULTISPECIES: AzlD domain-containing protein [Gordonia]|uniref:Branched-chain amino acid transporter n=2 Tax=Gordonia TaxID=2053 RepID=L7LN52_9ACTN|nr:MULTISPECIES: AzlD domain-containing protein [Gordonia]AUH67647.1 branched-chain amino acid transporter [Gordonia sp. YC-JH1]KJR08338.1 branched-chain amino acid transporter [Gordonia sihwensis]KXT57267.1 branched-chain amino acid transporter [Gordonia sp. QH-12]MBY4568761.1 branched-chain amino acid transporter [Gordonia sihwensis]WFN92690.1 AzlD domain-containing protein [Gordonia sihwensis]
MTGWEFACGVAILAGGTYLIRVAGVRLRSRITVSPAVETLLERSTMILLIAVGLTGALFAGTELSDPARPIGVAAGAVAALLRAPLAVVIVVAAATTAALRLVL